MTPDIKNISLDELSETVEVICGKLGAIVEYVIDRSDCKDGYDRSLIGSGALGTHSTYYAEDEETVNYLNIEPTDQELEEDVEESAGSEESL